MKINKVKLYNFSSYEGDNEFDFEVTDKKKNIILIGGKNGAGKTSLFTAIKVALYGPLAYGYVGANSYYTSKIKDLINSKAFQQETVEAELQITLELKIEREIKSYIITRKWNYTAQKLTEEYSVEKDGIKLDEQELSYFENYLQSIIPPDLFEFFLFDGEEVGNIFSTSAYNTYVKNAVFTLCGMDVFEIIRKYTHGYVSKNDSSEDNNAFEEYECAKKEFDLMESEKEHLEKDVSELTKDLEDVEVQLTELEISFKNAGGISRKEKKQLENEYSQAEKNKTETLTNIKMFVEGLMPFYILKDFVDPITTQLDLEEKGEIFYYIQSKLKRSTLEELLKDDVSDEKIDRLMGCLLDTFKPKGLRDDMEIMFDLSKEDIGRVNGIVSALDDFDAKTMIDTIKRRKEAADRRLVIADDQLMLNDPIPQRREIREIYEKIYTRVPKVADAEKEKANSLLKQLSDYLDYEDIDDEDIEDLVDKIKDFYETASSSLVNIHGNMPVLDGIKKDAKTIAVAFGEVEKGIDSDDSLDVLLMFSKDPLSKLERLLVALQTVQKDVEYVARDIAKRKENIFVDNGGDLSARYEESRKKIEADSRLVADWKVK